MLESSLASSSNPASLESLNLAPPPPPQIPKTPRSGPKHLMHHSARTRAWELVAETWKRAVVLI